VAPLFKFNMSPSSLSTNEGMMAAQLHRIGCDLSSAGDEGSLYIHTHSSNTAEAESLTLWRLDNTEWREATVNAGNVLDAVWRYENGRPEVVGTEVETLVGVPPDSRMEFELPNEMFGTISDVLDSPLSFAVVANSVAATRFVAKEGGAPASLEVTFQLNSCPNTWFVPTTAPTGSPTAMPTASPTAAPTWQPTSSPTMAPTASPTTVPTMSPTECVDSTTWHKAGRPLKTCAWTRGGTGVHRCKNVLGEDGTTGFESCPLSCGLC